MEPIDLILTQVDIGEDSYNKSKHLPVIEAHHHDIDPEPFLRILPPIPQEEPVVSQRGSLWFYDGNIILQAQMVQFRVHASLLSRCSTVFKDMLLIPQPCPSEAENMVDGCPIIYLHDSAKDIEVLLDSIYSHPYSGDVYASQRPMNVSMVSSMLRIGNKYDIPHIRGHALARLKLDQSSSYEGHKPHLGANSRFISSQPGKLVDLARLAYEEDVLSILPLILYRIVITYGTKAILKGVSRSDGTRATLPEALIYACIIGKETLAARMFSDSYVFLTPVAPTTIPEFYDQHPCSAERVCAEHASRLREDINQPLPDLELALDWSWDTVCKMKGLKFCSNCTKRYREAHETSRRAIWDSLPSIFGFTSWEEVKRTESPRISIGRI